MPTCENVKRGGRRKREENDAEGIDLTQTHKVEPGTTSGDTQNPPEWRASLYLEPDSWLETCSSSYKRAVDIQQLKQTGEGNSDTSRTKFDCHQMVLQMDRRLSHGNHNWTGGGG